jgi:hypothetical protein
MSKQKYTNGNPDSRDELTKSGYLSKPSKEESEQMMHDIASFERTQVHHPEKIQPPKSELIELNKKTTGKKYPGGFPEGFVQTLKNELTMKQGETPEEDILQTHGGGSSESKKLGGDTIDINPKTNPTVPGDNTTTQPYEELMKQRHGKKYKLVVVDPPWGKSQAKRLYNVKQEKFGKSLNVSSHYVEKGGRIVITGYHRHLPPPGYIEEKQILYDNRIVKSIPRRIQVFRRIK